MSITGRFNVNASIDNTTFAAQQVEVESDNVSGVSVTMAAAKIGQLTTRTDANTGTLTMNASHGITTGARLDLYWTGGSRRGMTVGTVATNSVPIDLGAGDDLPVVNTAVTAQVPQEELMTITGNNVVSIGVKGQRVCQVTFADGSEAELHAVALDENANDAYVWYTGNGVTNPLASDALVSVYLSNGDSSASNKIDVRVQHN